MNDAARDRLVSQLLVAMALVCSACAASRVPSPRVPVHNQIQNQLAAADRLVSAGCYDCLLEAFDIYEQLAPVDAGAAGAIIDTAGLIATRERVLALPDSHRLELARALDSDPGDAVIFDAIETLPALVSGTAIPDERLEASIRARRNYATWHNALQAPGNHPLLGDIAALAFDCAYGNREPIDAQRLLVGDRAIDTPLRQFASATCRGLDVPRLTPLRRADPRFGEIDYLLGEAAIASDLGNADQLIQRATKWRPAWAAAHMAAGDVAMLAEDFSRAADTYNNVLALSPDDPDALLRRTRALGYGGRYDAALETANRLIANRRWYTGEAQYWKAWNEAQMGRNDDAWVDVHEAAKLIVNADVPKLTGMLAIRRGEWVTAKEELGQAHARNSKDCETTLWLASVHLELRDWFTASLTLVDGVSCLDEHDTELRLDVDRLRSIAGRERSIARRERELADDEAARIKAWFNLAVAYFNQNDQISAADYAQRVITDSQFGERGRELLAKLKHKW